MTESDKTFERARELGYEFGGLYGGDLLDLQPLANGVGVSDAVEKSMAWLGFRAGLASYLVDHGVTAVTPPEAADPTVEPA